MQFAIKDRVWYCGLVAAMSAGHRKSLSGCRWDGWVTWKLRDCHHTLEGASCFGSLSVDMPMREEKEAERIPLLISAIPSLEHVINVMADSNAAKIDALHNLYPQLAHLTNVLAEERERQEKGLNKLLADENFDRIQKLITKQRNEFDALDFVGTLGFGSGDALWSSEEFHSNVLAWLLAPRRSHGLGDRFLTRFLCQAGMPSEDCQDWTATEVIREWPNVVDGQQGYLDILIVNHAQQILCAIENKVFSDEHGNQLTRYRKALEVSFPAFTRYLVFLTPRGTSPTCEEEKQHWKPLAYCMVFDIIQQIVDNHEISVRADVRAFLNQYTTTLRRNIMSETSLSQLARRTYLEHREAMDLIIANKPTWGAEARPWLKAAIAQQPEWLLDSTDGGFTRFRAADWDLHDVTKTGCGFPKSNAQFLFVFTFYDKRLHLELSLSPKNNKNDFLRHKLFEAVRQNPQLFKGSVDALADGWVSLYKSDYILNESDFGTGWDDGTTRCKLEKWIADFAANEFPAMNEIIVGCLQEIDAEKQAS